MIAVSSKSSEGDPTPEDNTQAQNSSGTAQEEANPKLVRQKIKFFLEIPFFMIFFKFAI